ncbi:unnamed protein product [Prunus armeniaca]|uniref:Uncharacterized protein n=1 Tax=Prunus armeniaca TaxID=36596 RepID=A0A6J5X397_PRUAR|nr:unnamed protein product [Prunus armeniaca]
MSAANEKALSRMHAYVNRVDGDPKMLKWAKKKNGMRRKEPNRLKIEVQGKWCDAASSSPDWWPTAAASCSCGVFDHFYF